MIKRAKDSSTWPNQWCLPGGKIEWGESFEEAGSRELKEESGLIISPENLIPIGVTNNIDSDRQRHRLTVILLGIETEAYRRASYKSKMNPEGCEMKWFQQSKPPKSIIPPLADFIKYNSVIWLADSYQIKTLTRLLRKFES